MSRDKFVGLQGLKILSTALLFFSAARLLAADKDTAHMWPVDIDTQSPVKVTIERAFPNLEFQRARPIFCTYPPDGANRLVVIGQRGTLFIFPNDQNVEEAKELLNINSKVLYRDVENETGLLGLAFHPKFKENGLFYVYYTLKDPKYTNILARFKISKDDPNRADPDSEEEILRFPAKSFFNHDGGTLIFGPDGYLYIAVGDGGAANDPNANGQNPSTLLAKILRIDVDHQDPGKKYAIPKDNPFVNLQGAAPEVWALGLRNVWRMAFDRQTHKLWAGDVGQDLWEEIDIIDKGGNYGWNVREGFHPFKAAPGGAPQGPAPEKIVGEFIEPIFNYHHYTGGGGGVGNSITGGGVYRGKQVPELFGAYLFADYVNGHCYALSYDEKDKKVTSVKIITADGKPAPSRGANNPPGVFSFGEDEAGEMYFMTTQGILNRFRSASK